MKLYGIRKKGTDEIEETFPSLEDSREKLPKGYEIVSREIEVNLEHRGKDLYVHKTYGEVEVVK